MPENDLQGIEATRRAPELVKLPTKQKGSVLIQQSPVRKGFTLIELLVVIAIISILATMLIPSLTRARDLARQMACSSKLRAMGVAIHTYAQDYNGSCPGPAVFAMALYDYPYFRSGYADIGWYLIQAEIAPSREENRSHWECPSHPTWDDFVATGYPKMHYVSHGSGNDGQLRPGPFGYPGTTAPASSPPLRLDEVASLTRGMAGTWGIQDVDIHNWDASYPIDPVHNGGRNVMYMDTHVEWLEVNDRADNPPSW